MKRKTLHEEKRELTSHVTNKQRHPNTDGRQERGSVFLNRQHEDHE